MDSRAAYSKPLGGAPTPAGQPMAKDTGASTGTMSTSVRVAEVHRVSVRDALDADTAGSLHSLTTPMLVRRASHSQTGAINDASADEYSNKMVSSSSDSGSGFLSLLRRAWRLLTSDRAAVYVSCAGLLLSWLGNNVLWIYASFYMGVSYAFWLNQACTALYVVVLLPIVAWRVWGPPGAPGHAGTITPAMRATVPWRTYAALGALDALYNLFTGLTSPRTSPPLQNLLFQLPVPAAIVMTKLLWRDTRYKLGQYIGAAVIVAGAVVSILPGLIHPAPDDGVDPLDPGATPAPTNDLATVLLYTLGVLFYTAMSVYKAHIVKSAPTLDFFYLSLSESVWNILWGFVFVPMLWIPHVGTDVPGNTWLHFAAGARCMFAGTSTPVSRGGDPSAQCGRSIWAWSLGWVVSNVAVTMLGLSVCQRGDAVLFNVVNSVQLPLSNLVYASTTIMTAALATPFDRTVWAGLALVCVGFAVYQFLPLEKSKTSNHVELSQTNREAAVVAAASGTETPHDVGVDEAEEEADASTLAPHAQPLHSHDPLIWPAHERRAHDVTS